LEHEIEKQKEEWQRDIEQKIKDRKEGAKETIEEQIDQKTQPLRERWQAFRKGISELFAGSTPEMPATVGQLDPDLEGQVDADVVRSAYLAAFTKLGETRGIGNPTDLVHDWDGLLAQSFGKNGEQSLIVMGKHDRSAYGIQGPWLDRFQELGGPKEAGKPRSNVERFGYSWLLVVVPFGKGSAQRFQDPNGQRYAFMQAQGTDDVRVVPPAFWHAYETQSGPKEIGYPIVGYPLQEPAAQRSLDLSEDELGMLQSFLAQPQRVMAFQRGSIVVDRDSGAAEVLNRQVLNGGETKLALGALSVLADKYWSEFADPSADFGCDHMTLNSAAAAAGGRFVTDVMNTIKWLPIKSALAVVPVNSVGGRLLLAASEVFVGALSGQDWVPSLVSQFAQEIVGSIYPYLFGQVLELPLGAATDQAIDLRTDQIYEHMKETLVIRLRIEEGQYRARLGETTGTTDLIVYNPYTHLVTIVIDSDCNEHELYVIQYRANAEAEPAQPTDTWDGVPRFWKFPGGERF
jgi:hypothetical protein